MSNSSFRTAVVRTPGGPESIEIIAVPAVEPGPGEVLIRIAAAAVNPVDLAVAGGLFHGRGPINQPEYTSLGWDFAGTVAASGPGVDLAVGTEGRRRGHRPRPRLRYLRRTDCRAGCRCRGGARRRGSGRDVDGAAQRTHCRTNPRPPWQTPDRGQPTACDRRSRSGRRIPDSSGIERNTARCGNASQCTSKASWHMRQQAGVDLLPVSHRR